MSYNYTLKYRTYDQLLADCAGAQHDPLRPAQLQLRRRAAELAVAPAVAAAADPRGGRHQL